MSIQAVGWVLDHSTAEGRERLVLLSLANHAGRDEWECWPSVATIAREARVSVRTAQRSLRLLEEQGHIEVAERGEPDLRVRADRRANLYRIVRTDEVSPAVTPSQPDEVTAEARRGDRSDAESAIAPHMDLEPKGEPSLVAEATVISFPGVDTPLSVQQQVESVFAAWLDATGKTGRSVLDAKRTRKIKWALDLYPLEDVTAAVRGWRHSPFHCGENQHGKVYNDLDLLLRDTSHVEHFRDLELGLVEQHAGAANNSIAAIQRLRQA